MNKETKETENDQPKFVINKVDQKYIKRVCNNNTISAESKIDILVEAFDVTRDTMAEMIDFIGMSLSQSQFSAAKLRTLKKKKRYIISSAQTASPVNLTFLHNLEAYAKFIDAEIGIIATRYRNPTSTWKEEGDVWDERVHKYLIANKQYIHKSVVVLADLKIQATSPNPTNGIELFGNNSSCIVGSPRIEMRSVPVLPTQEQKFLYATGTTTESNFTDTVAGGKADAHHSFGFIIVEIEDDNIAHIRNVSADKKGCFNDLIYRVENEIVTEESTETLVWGDSHFAQKEDAVTDAFRALCADLGITKSVLHDVWDSESLNVHNTKNPIVQYELYKENKDDLKKEINHMLKELKWFEDNMVSTLVIASNHDDMLDRAMYQGDWRDNIRNAETFVKMLSLTLSGKAPDGVIPYMINKKFEKITALGVDDSYIRNDVELALHGHKGANGARGNISGFSKLSHKTIIGHSHSPSIKWGCYQVGISCGMKHGYNKGLSGWAYAGVTLNKYGKRQMIVFNKKTLTYTTLY